MSAAAESPRPRQKLGELLVEAGLLAPAALELALEEQQQTGRTLGQILVGRGFLPAPTLAAALAEQSGGLLKTEYGYATGLSGLRRTTPSAPPPLPPVSGERPTNVVPLDRPLPEPQLGGGPRPPLATEPELAAEPAPEPELAAAPQPDVVAERVVEPELSADRALEPELGAEPQPELVAEPAPEPDPAVELEPEPEPEPTQLEPERVAEPAAEPPAPAAGRADIDDLRARHEALIAAHAQLEAVIGERDRRIRDLEEQFAALQASHGEAMVALASARTAAEGERQRFEEMLPELARSAAETVELNRRLAEEREKRAHSEGALAERSSIEEEIARLAIAHAERDERRLEQKLEEQALALARAEAAIADAETRATDAESRTDALRAALEHARKSQPKTKPESEPGVESRHLLFVPTADGYELLEREGAAPALDAVVELDRRHLLVVRVGPSPLPRDGARCAYLERIPQTSADN
jgi:hypothetical protein